MDLLISGANVLLIMVGFGLLIFIHELGHFIAAKWAGIRTHAFAIGFGPPIFSWRKGVGLVLGSSETVIRKRCGRGATQMTDRELSEEGLGETEYSLRWLPLGGFVRMLGQDDLDPSDRAIGDRGFSGASIGKRMVVISAGVIMNVLLAIVCFVIAFSVGVPFEAPVIGEVAPNSPASFAVASTVGVHEGLQPGDVVIAIDGQPADTFIDLQVAAGMSLPGVPIQLEVQRPGVAEPITFSVEPEESAVTGMRGIGVMPPTSLHLSDMRDLRPIVRNLVKSVGLGETGIGPGWSIVSLDGKDVDNYGEFEQAAAISGGGPMKSVWHGGGGEKSAVLLARPQWETLAYVGATAEMVVGFEAGIGGFVPLIQIERVPAGGQNSHVLQAGDVILAVAGSRGPRMQTVRNAIANAPGNSVSMRIVRDGIEIPVEVRVARSGVLGQGTKKAGVYLNYAWESPLMAAPMLAVKTATNKAKTTLAGEVPDGVLAGSRWVSIDDVPVAHWRDVWIAFRKASQEGKRELTMVIENPTIGREQRSIAIPLADTTASQIADLQWQAPLPSLCFESVLITRSSNGNPILAVQMGVQETWKFIVVTYLTIDRLVRGSVGVDQLHGPVGIVHVGTKVADRGFMYLIFFLGIISVNLAVLNFLPLPIVDGGMFLYLVYEKVRGVPPSVGFQNAAMLLGFVLILTAVVVTFFNDIGRLIG